MIHTKSNITKTSEKGQDTEARCLLDTQINFLLDTPINDLGTGETQNISDDLLKKAIKYQLEKKIKSIVSQEKVELYQKLMTKERVIETILETLNNQIKRNRLTDNQVSVDTPSISTSTVITEHRKGKDASLRKPTQEEDSGQPPNKISKYSPILLHALQSSSVSTKSTDTTKKSESLLLPEDSYSTGLLDVQTFENTAEKNTAENNPYLAKILDQPAYTNLTDAKKPENLQPKKTPNRTNN